MSERERELAARRAALLAESAMQREQFTHLAHDLEMRLAGIDRGIRAARALAKKPIVIVGAIALIALIGPKRLLRFATRGAALIATGRRVTRLLR
ncbi:MAG TPA: YqjK family protein [Steroidobacteraceae bacterium]